MEGQKPKAKENPGDIKAEENVKKNKTKKPKKPV